MMFASLTVVLFSAHLSTCPITANWRFDYSSAYREAHTLQKPLLVVFAQGKAQPNNILTHGEISPSTRKLLVAEFICCYIDSESESGKKLAEQYALSKGLVISDRGGNNQALRHEGALTPEIFNRYVEDVIEPTAILTTTSYGTTAIPAQIPRRTPIRNVIGNLRESIAPQPYTLNPFDPNCRT